MVAPDNGRIADILAQSQALRGTLGQRFDLQDQALQNIQALPPETNFGGDLVNSFLNQASFNVLNNPAGNGVGSTLGRVGGGFANAAALVGLLGLTPLAPEVTIPAGLGLAGLLGGGSLEARQQVNQSGTITDPGAVLTQGGIEGALNLIPGSKAAGLGRRLLTDVGVQGGAGLIGDAASQAVRGQSFNPNELLQGGAMGAGMGVLSALLGGPHAKNLSTPEPAGIPEARALLQQNVNRANLPDNITVDPLLYARPELQSLDAQMEALLGRTKPVDALPSVRDVDASLKVDPVMPEVQGPKPGANGYIDRETITSPVAQTFLNRSSAMRGARNLGLERAEVQPVQVGPGEWMIHKVEPVTPEAPKTTAETPKTEAPVIGEPTAAPLPEVANVHPAEPARLPDNNAANIPASPAGNLATALAKPETVTTALRGLDSKDSVTVHDFDLSTVEPGTKLEGLGTFKGFDEAGLPIVSRKGGLGRPGESGFAHDEESLAGVLQKANEVLQPGDAEMLQQIMQDVQSGQATQFTGRAKQGRSADMAASADTPGTLGAFGTKTNDRVIGVYFKPASAKTPAQVVARVVNSLGEQSTRILRDAGNPDVGYMRTGNGPHLEMHNPSTIATQKRSLASDAAIEKAAIVRKAAMGTKHEAHPIVQRLDQAIQSNNVKDLELALRDFDRLPPELQRTLSAQAGCVK